MKEEAFRSWLSNNRGYGSGTVSSRISNCKTVEDREGDLDQHFDQDHLGALLDRLKYSKEDERQNRTPRHRIPIDGNIYDGTATLRSAVSLYKQFREQGNAEAETLPNSRFRPRELANSRSGTKMAPFTDFFLQFLRERAIGRDSIFTEPELIAWFHEAHPHRTPSNIHNQLLKKSVNYPARVRFIPAPSQSDDLFFALDPAFQTFRLYRDDEDPPPIYGTARGSTTQLQAKRMERSASRGNRTLVRDGLLLAPGTVLEGRYRIIRHLAAGGMGAVYEAVDQRLSSIVALKETLTSTAEMRRAFEREASLLANLQHSSLPVVIDHFHEANGQFLVMQFISGDDLGARLEQRGKAFSVSEVQVWAVQLLDALDYLHLHNPPIVHRDIKPLNLKLGRRGEAILLDFGLAKGALGQMPTMTGGMSVLGYTRRYAPLEQIHGAGTDPRSDIYSLGATLYHLVTGTAPVDAPTRYNAIEDGQSDPLRPAHEMNSEVTEDLSDVIRKAMAISRKERWTTAAEMRKALEFAVGGRSRPIIGPGASPTSEVDLANEDARQERIVYFNNCNNRNHVRLYGTGAFYDLGTTGFQSGLARNLRVGQKCIVATTGIKNQIVFSWFSFLRKEVKRDDRGIPCRVFFGELIYLEEWSKAEAAKKEPYSKFFDVNGNFKRHSVIEALAGRITMQADIGSRSRAFTTEGEFFEALQNRSPVDADVAKKILNWSRQHFSRVDWKHSSFVPVLEYGAESSHNPITVFAVGKVPRVGIKFGRMKKRNGISEEKRISLLRRLNAIPGVNLAEDDIDKYPNILLKTLATGNALEQFLQAIAWTNEEVTAMQKHQGG